MDEDTTTTATTTTPATAEVERETIPQKVAKLNDEKAQITSQMAGLEDGPAKTALADRIVVIDRKVRWYAGRTGATKGGKAARPTKGKASKKPAAKAPVQSAPAPGSAPSAPLANES